MITDEERRNVAANIRSAANRRKDDALCNLDSSGPGMWQRLANLIEGKN